VLWILDSIDYALGTGVIEDECGDQESEKILTTRLRTSARSGSCATTNAKVNADPKSMP